MENDSIMKHIRIVILSVILSFFTITLSAQETTYEQLGYITIPDINKTITAIENFASKTNPEKIRPGMLKMQAGMLIGDPMMQNVETGKPVLAVFYNEQTAKPAFNKRKTHFAVFIPAKDNSRARKMLAGIRMMPAIQDDNTVILSDSLEALTQAKNEMSLYKSVAGKQLNCTLSLVALIGNITKIYKNDIDGFLNKTRTNMNNMQQLSPDNAQYNESAYALGKLIIYAMIEFVKQTGNYRLDLTLNDNSILLESWQSALQGTPLYKYFTVTAPPNNKSLSILPDTEITTYAGYNDTAMLKNFINSIIDTAEKTEPGLRKKIGDEIFTLLFKIIDINMGETAFQLGFSDNGNLKINSVITTEKTEQEFLTFQEENIRLSKLLMKNFNNNSNETVLEKNVRVYKGVNIHRSTQNIKNVLANRKPTEKQFTGIPMAGEAQINKIFRDLFGGEVINTEFAVSNGYIVSSTDGKALEKMIDNTVNGGKTITLTSMKDFGNGMNSYMDFKLADILEKVAKISEESAKENTANADSVKSMTEILSSLNPDERVILYSGKCEDGVSLSKFKIPERLIIELIKYSTRTRVEKKIIISPAKKIPESEDAIMQ